MPVRVKLFASVREAAGTGDIEVEPGSLPDVLASLDARFGPEFARRATACSVLVDGSVVHRIADRQVPDGAEVALLPPVSGGAEPAGSVSERRHGPGLLDSPP